MSRGIVWLVFLLIPFQKRFHGYFDVLSRKLTLPDFPLPSFFSRKIHLFVSDILILILLFLLLFYYRASLRAFFWEGPSKYLLLLFCVFFLSTWHSSSGCYSLQYLRLLEFSLVFLFFNALSVLYPKKSLVREVALVLLVGALLESGIGLWQYFSQHEVGLKFLGEEDPRLFSFISEGPLWIFGSQTRGQLSRAAGTFAHPNILGGFLFSSLIASYYLYSTFSKKRLFFSLVIVIQLFVLCLTFSRSAFLALFLATAIVGWLQITRGIRILKWGTLMGCACLLSLCLLYPQLKARGGFINYNQITSAADNERMAYMKVAVQMLREHPLIGVGFNHFQIDAHRQQPQYPQYYLHSKVHNIYLLVAAESGLIGSGLFLLFLFSVIRSGWKGIREGSEENVFLLPLFLGLLFIGGCDFYFLDGPHGSLLFFGIAGLLCDKKRSNCYSVASNERKLNEASSY